MCTEAVNHQQSKLRTPVVHICNWLRTKNTSVVSSTYIERSNKLHLLIKLLKLLKVANLPERK